jgi:hypothetical protein
MFGKMDHRSSTRLRTMEAPCDTYTRTQDDLIAAIDRRIQRTETTLLNAFVACHEHVEEGMCRICVDIANFNAASELRLTNLEERVIELEKKLLLMHPPAAQLPRLPAGPPSMRSFP